MSRRQVLTAMGISPIGALAAMGSTFAQTKTSTFVLVHGAWHGGWCWNKLTPLLRAAGHQVFTPTLTGLGERSHLLSEQIDLETHIQDITQVLEYDDLKDVVLVGHSYGGMVITGVTEKAHERIAQLVYLDAFLPENGRAVQDYAPLPPTRADGWRVPIPGPVQSFGVTNESDAAWMEPRVGDQPLKTFTHPVQLSTARYALLPKTFVQCSEAPWFTEAAQRAKAAGFRSFELLSAGHDSMITQPKELAAILQNLV